MNESTQETLDRLAEEFGAQCAAGKRPSVEEFATRYPELSEDIRDLFPTLELVATLLPEDKSEPDFPGSDNGLENGLENLTIEDFRLIRELGRGGMGVVYEAEQLSLKRRVAIKVLPMAYLLGSQRRARFEQEAKAAGRLHHTNIVPVFGIGSSEEVTFLIMQLIPGLSLDKLIARLRRAHRLDNMFVHTAADDVELDEVAKDVQGASEPPANVTIGVDYWRDVASLGRQVAEALQYANDQGILHRDIKPGNLILDENNRTWVADFGLAKILDSDELTNTGDVLGTVKYMAPERLNGEYSERSEVYSLGATLYELAALQPAFSSTAQGILGRKLLREPPQPLRKLRPSMPRDLCTIIEKAMAVEPKNRYQTSGEFAADLVRFLNNEPINARTTSFGERTIRWSRRNPLLATMVTTLATCLLVAAIVSMRAAQHFRRLNSELATTNEDLKLANFKATTEQNLSQQRETRLLFQRGREIAEQGKIAEGLLLMADALRQCPDELQDYDHVIRANISAWSALVPEILEINPDPFHRFRAIDHGENGSAGEFFLFADDTVRQIDTKTGKQIGTAFELGSFALDCAVSDQGSFVAVTSRDNQNELLVLNLEDRAQSPFRLVIREHYELDMPYWHPNGRSVAVRTSHENRFVVWDDFRSPEYKIYQVAENMDAESLSFLAEFMPGGKASQVWEWERERNSPDGRLRIDDLHATTLINEAGTENHLRLSLPHPQNVKTTADGQQFQTTHFRIRNLRSCSRLPPNSTATMEVAPSKYWNHSTAAFSQDGETAIVRDPHIVFWSEPERKVLRTAAQLLDTRTGQPIGEPLQHPFDSVRAVAISRDGAIAATGGYHFGQVSGAAYVWDAKSGRQLCGPLIHVNYVSALDISPDGKRLAAGDYSGHVRIWDVATGEQIGETIQAGKIVFALRFDPQGQRIAVGMHGEMRSSDNFGVWDIATSMETRLPHPAAVDGTEWIPHANRLISYDTHSIRLWAPDQQPEPIASLDDIGQILGTSVSEDGKLIAVGTSIGSVYLMDAVTGEVLPNTLSHPSTIYDVDLGADGKTLSVACNDGGLRIWDLDTFEQLGPPLMQNAPLYRTVILPDGKTALSTSRDGTTRSWNIPQHNDAVADQLGRLVEIRTGKRFENGIALKIPIDEWTSLREQAIQSGIMLSQADSASNSEGMPALVSAISPHDLHEARCRDAEQDKDWFGAHWHLSQMIPDDSRDLRESDWQLFARRARTWSERGDFEQASQDYDSASSLLVDEMGESENLVNWYRHRVVACQRTEQWQTAIWYLDRILMLEDNDWNAYASRAEAYLKLGNKEEHAADLEEALKLCDDPIFQQIYQE